MTPRLSRASVGLALGSAVLLASSAGSAQSLAPSNVHTPKVSQQLPPLRVEVLDGSRFRDIETNRVYRLYGIDTCAPAQMARLGRQPWPCGTVASAWLVSATLNKWLACSILREDQAESLARCASAEHADIGADMIRAGVAVMSPPTDQDPAIRAYAALERDARKSYRGIWASAFQMPWEYKAFSRQRAIATMSEEAVP